MRAALLTAFDPLQFMGGIERYTVELLALLRRRGIEVDIFHTGQVDDDMGLHNKLMGKIFALGRAFSGVDGDYDFAIAHSFYGLGYFPPKIRTYNIYHSSHVAFDESVEGVISHVTYLEWTYLCGYFAERVSGFDRIKIAVSDEVRQELQDNYGFGDVRVVESGVDTGLFRKIEERETLRKRYRIPGDAYVGVFVGRWDKTKGSDVVEKVIGRTPDIFWLLVLGTGSEHHPFGGRENVRVLEQVPYEVMPEVYSLSDFMFFPSRYEGFGLVIIEALACGLPLLTGDIGIAKKLFREGLFSALRLPHFPTASEEALIGESVEKIYALRGDERLRRLTGEAGRTIVEERYTIGHWHERMLQALDFA